MGAVFIDEQSVGSRAAQAPQVMVTLRQPDDSGLAGSRFERVFWQGDRRW
jgi:hypothetical protein